MSANFIKLGIQIYRSKTRQDIGKHLILFSHPLYKERKKVLPVPSLPVLMIQNCSVRSASPLSSLLTAF